MVREVLVKRMVGKIEQLPMNRIRELNDFVEFMAYRADDALITKGLQQLAVSSSTFDFLDSEPDLYTVNDLKIRYA
jgi:hypothetical protein